MRRGQPHAKAARRIEPGRIRSMLATRSVDQVAADLRMDPAEVEMVAATGSPVVLRCNDSGREWRTTGWRGAYRRVCLLGLTDWDWRREGPGARC